MSHGDEPQDRHVSTASEADGQDSPSEQQRDPQGVPREGRRQPSRPDDVEPGEERALEGRITEGERQELIAEAAIAAVTAIRSETYSGLLPHPDHWGQFEPETKERILRMSEAYTSDESQRRDRLVNAEIHEAAAGRWSAVLTMALALGLGMVALVLTNGNPWAAAPFVALPIMNVASDFIRGRNGAPQNGSQQRKDNAGVGEPE